MLRPFTVTNLEWHKEFTVKQKLKALFLDGMLKE
jgi:hypothetical protein